VLRGETRYVIPNLPAGGADERELTLEYEVVPVDDLVMVTDVHGDGFGSHGETPYRFGREVAPPPIAPRGQATLLNGANLGAPIQMGGQ
jgi:hypothetical protein